MVAQVNAPAKGTCPIETKLRRFSQRQSKEGQGAAVKEANVTLVPVLARESGRMTCTTTVTREGSNASRIDY